MKDKVFSLDEVAEISLVSKPSCGPFLAVDRKHSVVLGVVGTGGHTDNDGDTWTAEEIRKMKALWESSAPTWKVNHGKPIPEGQVRVVKSGLTTGRPARIPGCQEQVPPHSWWIAAKLSKELMQRVLMGNLTGFSISGRKHLMSAAEIDRITNAIGKVFDRITEQE
jgi:hypothetical protein